MNAKALILSTVLGLSACSTVDLYWCSEEPSDDMLDRMSDRALENCGFPIIFNKIHLDPLNIEAGREWGMYYNPVVEATKGSDAITKIVWDSSTGRHVGMAFQPTDYIYILWEADAENVLMHELGHRFTLDHTPDDRTSTMFPTQGSGEPPLHFTDAQWEQFCDSYRTEIVLKFLELHEEANDA